jgi:hypothetical protein
MLPSWHRSTPLTTVLPKSRPFHGIPHPEIRQSFKFQIKNGSSGSETRWRIGRQEWNRELDASSWEGKKHKGTNQTYQSWKEDGCEGRRSFERSRKWRSRASLVLFDAPFLFKHFFRRVCASGQESLWGAAFQRSTLNAEQPAGPRAMKTPVRRAVDPLLSNDSLSCGPHYAGPVRHWLLWEVWIEVVWLAACLSMGQNGRLPFRRRGPWTWWAETAACLSWSCILLWATSLLGLLARYDTCWFHFISANQILRCKYLSRVVFRLLTTYHYC